MVGTPGAVMGGRDRLVVVLGVAILGILGAGVLASSSPDARSGATPSPSTSTLVEGIVGRATSVNPLEPRNAADLDLIALVFSGLTRSFPDGSVGPDLAESWTISRDGKVYTFTLRAGAVWQDGQPVTADDVVFTVLTIQDADYQGPLRASWRSVKVEKVDLRRVRFTLAEPLGAFLQASTLPILPAHLLIGTPVASLVDAVFNREPVGSGPYRLLRLDFDEAELVLAASPQDGAEALELASPGGGLGGPDGPIRRLLIRFYPDTASLVDAYRSGAVDTAAGLLPGQVRELTELPDTTIIHYPSTTVTLIVPNVRSDHRVFANIYVRRGLLRSLDREGIIDGLYDGAAERADSPISPASWAYDAKKATVYAFDRAAAVKDLEAAGWKRDSLGWKSKDGKPVAFSVAAIDAAGDPLDNALARAIATEWTGIGLDATVVDYRADGFVTQLVRGNFDLALLEVNMGLDPDVFPLLTSSQAVEGGSNVGGYQSAALDSLLKAARLGVDRKARIGAFSALQAALTRELPLLPIAFADDLYVVRDGVVGPGGRLVADRSGRFWDVLTWRLADGPAGRSP
jgi:peptide/nickel transport system substrate-binding protein